MAYKNAALAEEKRQYDNSLAFQKEQAAKSSSGGGGGNGGNGGSYSGFTDGTPDPKETLQSVLDLGQGPISAENLAQQVASGKVRETKDENGNTTFEYTNTAKAASLLTPWLQ
jgi:hypothetical protein